MNLAKHPASTVQILGAEKALFRALKTKHDTPKYGLIYHASLVGQTNTKLKGKVRWGAGIGFLGNLGTKAGHIHNCLKCNLFPVQSDINISAIELGQET